jgi:hypothetical protein
MALVEFGSLISMPYQVVPSSFGMRWRARFSENLVRRPSRAIVSPAINAGFSASMRCPSARVIEPRALALRRPDSRESEDTLFCEGEHTDTTGPRLRNETGSPAALSENLVAFRKLPNAGGTVVALGRSQRSCRLLFVRSGCAMTLPEG